MTTPETLSRMVVAMILLVLAIGVLIGPQTAQAELNDDPLPFNPNYKCENSNWEALMCNVHTMMGFARKISGIFSGFKGTFDAATFLGQVLGILGKEVNLADELKKLHEHLDKLGAKLDERAVKREQANQLSFGLRMVETASQNVKLGMPFNQNTPGVNEAAAYIKAAMDPLYFERFFMEEATDGETRGEWKDVIWDRRPATPGSGEVVYDWRVGIPQLMQLIALRLAILPVIDPNFAKDQVFKTELLGYRKTLDEHYDKMINSVHCNWAFGKLYEVYKHSPEHARVVCADIYTGVSAISDWLESQARSSTSYTECYRLTDWDGDISRVATPDYEACLRKFLPDDGWAAFANTTILQTKEALRRQVLRKMPLFEMRSMIDMLFLYAHGGYDLTEAEEHIALAVKPNLCLDTQWGNLAPETPVWLWDCNGGDAQWWRYDRQSGTILNPASSLCLDVQEENLAPGTPVWLYICNGRDAQKWTYDPEQRVLQSALGTVLQVKVPERVFCDHYINGSCASNQSYVDYDSLTAGAPVNTWVRTEEPRQQWITDASPPVTKPKCQEGMLSVQEERCDETPSRALPRF